MYRSTHAAIERAAAMRPALIVLDDAHAIDPSALALARFVVRASRRSPILVVLTARPTGAARTESGDAFADLVAEGEIVQLGALERDDVASLLEDAGRPAGESDVSALLELAGGSPLLIREALMSPGSFTGAPLPNRARHLLATRLGGFGPTAKRVLAAAAVVGPRVTHAEVAATAGVGIE
ncbi:MAG: hypothetical protein ACXVJ3_05020, partial [Ilumatobacteraceae bacterium]